VSPGGNPDKELKDPTKAFKRYYREDVYYTSLLEVMRSLDSMSPE
jgi:hypothetical protein